MRRLFLLTFALALVLSGTGLLLARLREAAALSGLIRAARISPQPVRRGRWVVLGPRFTGTTVVDPVKNIRVKVRGDRFVKLQYGSDGNRGEVSDYATRRSAAFPWRIEGATLDYRDGCLIVRR